jgi:HPt (histidine-containing phosphotransfer) domain-containing protein
LSIADQSEIYALAHKLKSSASNVGVIQVSDVAKKIEADAKAGSLIDFQEKLEYLENVVDTALNALADWG